MDNIQKLNLFGHVETAKLESGLPIKASFIDELQQTQKPDFKTVFSGLAQELNQSMEKPDALLADLVSGKPNVDIHDVMTAISKAELGLSISTQITTKVIQAYDRVSQIQV